MRGSIVSFLEYGVQLFSYSRDYFTSLTLPVTSVCSNLFVTSLITVPYYSGPPGVL